MGTSADKLNKLIQTKADIKDAIIEKGGVVNDSTPFGDYAQAIRDISGGGGGIRSYLQSETKARSKVIGADSSIDYFVKQLYAVTPILASHTEGNYPLSNINDGDTRTFWSCGSRQAQGEWIIFDISSPLNDTDRVALSTCWYNNWSEYPSTVSTFVISTAEATSVQMGTLDFFNSNYHVIDTYRMSQFTGENFIDGKYSLETVGELKQILGADTFCIGMLMFCNSGSAKIAECSGIKA